MIPNKGSAITNYNDQRITKIGFYLRKFKIDELPQLLNIIRGEMRFIGPRPEVKQYSNEEDFKFLKIIKPGISDFASILFRNEDNYMNVISGQNPYFKLLEVKTELANYYAEKKSFQLDLFLTMLTVFAIFFPRLSSRILIKNLPLKKLDKTDRFFKMYNV